MHFLLLDLRLLDAALWCSNFQVCFKSAGHKTAPKNKWKSENVSQRYAVSMQPADSLTHADQQDFLRKLLDLPAVSCDRAHIQNRLH